MRKVPVTTGNQRHDGQGNGAASRTTKAWAKVWVATAALTIVAAGCNAGASGGAGGSAGGDTVATVNGENVGRNDLHRFLEAVNGESALRQLIDHQLIAQEVKKQGLTISEQDIDEGVAEQKRQQSGPALEEFERITKAAGPGLEALRRNLRSEIALNRLVTKDVKVDEAQLKKWFEKNKAQYSKPATIKLGVLLAATKARADLMAQQLQKKSKTFAQLVDEQKQANHPIGARSWTHTPEFYADSLPHQLRPVLGKQAAKMKQGDISLVLSLGAPGQQASASSAWRRAQPPPSPTLPLCASATGARLQTGTGRAQRYSTQPSRRSSKSKPG